MITMIFFKQVISDIVSQLGLKFYYQIDLHNVSDVI